MTERLININSTGEVPVKLFARTQGTLEIYADGIHGVMISGEVIKLNFITDVMDEDTTIKRQEVVATVVIPLSQLAPLSELFTKIISQAGIFKPVIE